MTHHMLVRSRAAQDCIDTFVGKSLSWGKHDCLKLFRCAIHKQGVGLPLLKGIQYRSERGALKSMRGRGFKDLREAVDATGLACIPPAMAWPGDIVALPAIAPWGVSLMVAVGNGRLLGLYEGVFVVLEPKQFVCAWRVPVRDERHI